MHLKLSLYFLCFLCILCNVHRHLQNNRSFRHERTCNFRKLTRRSNARPAECYFRVCYFSEFARKDDENWWILGTENRGVPPVLESRLFTLYCDTLPFIDHQCQPHCEGIHRIIHFSVIFSIHGDLVVRNAYRQHSPTRHLPARHRTLSDDV